MPNNEFVLLNNMEVNKIVRVMIPKRSVLVNY